MQKLQGVSLSPGLSKGRAWILYPALESNVPQRDIGSEHVAQEIARLDKALARSEGQLKRLKDELIVKLHGTEMGIVDTHAVMIQDPVFVGNIRGRIDRDLVNAERAVAEEVEGMVSILHQSQSSYLQERSSDVRDVGRRLLRNLRDTGTESEPADPVVPEQTILVAEEVLPSYTMEIDRTRIVGIVSSKGGPSSHAAILARALGIPFVGGLQNLLDTVAHGSVLLVNGSSGEVVVDPTPIETRHFSVTRSRYEGFVASLLQEEREPSVTSDGASIALWGNIADPSEAAAVTEHRLKGVGLLRTEFLFLTASSSPDIRKHSSTYGRILRELPGRTVTVRTMDMGADKIPKFLKNADTVSVRVRGLRFSLEHPNMLKTQMRGMLRAGGDNRLRILFPMVIGYEDLERAVACLHWAADREGVSELPRIGAMIETPSALFELDAIMDLADFLSVGTNDLTQYMLAIDRQETDAEGYYAILYPGMLHALKMLIDRATEKGREISICGEAAGDPAIACLLVGMGYRNLSMSPVRAAAVRHAIRGAAITDLEDLASKALQGGRTAEIRHIVETAARGVERPLPA